MAVFGKAPTKTPQPKKKRGTKLRWSGKLLIFGLACFGAYTISQLGAVKPYTDRCVATATPYAQHMKAWGAKQWHHMTSDPEEVEEDAGLLSNDAEDIDAVEQPVTSAAPNETGANPRILDRLLRADGFSHLRSADESFGGLMVLVDQLNEDQLRSVYEECDQVMIVPILGHIEQCLRKRAATFMNADAEEVADEEPADDPEPSSVLDPRIDAINTAALNHESILEAFVEQVPESLSSQREIYEVMLGLWQHANLSERTEFELSSACARLTIDACLYMLAQQVESERRAARDDSVTFCEGADCLDATELRGDDAADAEELDEFSPDDEEALQ
ncbi:MAG: hypothetical protein ABIG71_02695 [Candidatus Uhrbacteria bacterium]